MVTTRDKIAQYLQATGRSRKWLSEQLGIKENYISMILSGKREPSERITRLIDSLTESKERPSHPNPTIEAVIQMMEAMDEDTQKDVQVSVQKEKLLRELLKEKQDKEAA